MTHPTLVHYLVVAAALFGLGVLTAVARRSVMGTLLGLQLVFLSAGLNFVAFDRFVAPALGEGRIFAVFVAAFAACEAVVALALAFEVHRPLRRASSDE
jgi:NADH:ubiquinone oxidoreductase subunit K